MFRPTPGRLFYLLVGLVVGGLALYAYTAVAGTPSFLPSGRSAPTAQRPAAEFSGTKLTKVLPVNQEATKSGVLVRINTLEEYSDGFSLTYSILSGQPSEPAPTLQPESFGLTDDRGSSYRLSPLGSSSSVGPGLSSGYLSFGPALSPDARTLTVTVPHLVAVGAVGESGASRVVDGPWQFQVTLR
jgi:hypothetical protein